MIKHIGLSEVNVDEIKKAQQFVKVVSVQNMYSVDNRKWEKELQFCSDNHMAFIPWYPLNAGNIKAVEKLKKVGEKYNASPNQVALSWLLHRAENILLIPGTSKVKHLEENYQAATISLTDEDMSTLDDL